MDPKLLQQLEDICPAAFYRPNVAAPSDWIVAHGGLPGTRSEGDAVFFESDAIGRAPIGGNRAGKTTKLVMEGGSYCLGFRPWYEEGSEWRTRGIPERTNRVPIRVRYIVQNLRVHVPEVMKEIRRWWPDEFWNVSARNEHGYPMQLTWFNGNLWTFMSHKQEATDFEQIESDLLLWDEPPPQRLWESLNRGLVSTGGRWCVGATFLDSNGWFWDAVILPHDGRKDGPTRITWHSMWDNTAENGGCDTQSVTNVLSYLESIADPDTRLAREHGHPISVSGRVLNNFRDELAPAGSLVEPFELPRSSLIVAAIDPAGTRPFAAMHIAYLLKEDGEWEGHIFDETLIPQTGRDLPFFCQVFNEKERGETVPRHPTRSAIILIDPIAESTEKADRYGRSMRRILAEEHGIECALANRANKRARLLSLNARFGQKRYYVWTTCPRFRAEAKSLVWDAGTPKLVRGADDLFDCGSYIDSLDPVKLLKGAEGEKGGVWVPPEYRDRERQMDAQRRHWAAREEKKKGAKQRWVAG